jgi:hypothetical protein
MRWLSLALSAALLCVAFAASAELYKCQGSDGKTLFTSDRSHCPGAQAHEPSGSVQRSESSLPVRAPSPLQPARPAAKPVIDDEAEAQVWRAKRREAALALSATETRLATVREVAGWCNRGHEVWSENEDGLRRGIDCDEVDALDGQLRREKKRLEAYLSEGLEEECRRAGCLPGWIR